MEPALVETLAETAKTSKLAVRNGFVFDDLGQQTQALSDKEDSVSRKSSKVSSTSAVYCQIHGNLVARFLFFRRSARL